MHGAGGSPSQDRQRGTSREGLHGPGDVGGAGEPPFAVLGQHALQGDGEALGYVGPAFEVRGMLVWGFTGGLLDRILSIAGFAVPWSTDRVVPLPDLPLREDDGTGP